MTTNNPLLKVVAAEYVHDYTLRLTFNTGEVRLVDFTPLMQKGICRKLQDLEYFKSFRLDPFTVDWNDEIGFAPRYLYERGMAAQIIKVQTEKRFGRPMLAIQRRPPEVYYSSFVSKISGGNLISSSGSSRYSSQWSWKQDASSSIQPMPRRRTSCICLRIARRWATT